jgi:hypothetical protein
MPQSSAQKAHADLCLLPTVRPVAKLPSRLRRWGWIPTHGPVKRILSSLPPPSELALARQSGAVTMTHVQDKLTNWGTPRPHHRTAKEGHVVFAYGTIALCGATFQSLRLTHDFVTSRPAGRRIEAGPTTTVYPNVLPLAAIRPNDPSPSLRFRPLRDCFMVRHIPQVQSLT